MVWVKVERKREVMIYVNQEDFSPGMVSGQQIYVIKNGRALLQGGAGLKLTDSIISALKRNKVEKLLIEDSDFEDIQPESILSSMLEYELRIAIKDKFSSVNPKAQCRADEKFLKLIDKVINEVPPDFAMFAIRNYTEENFLLEHSFNVGVVSIALAKRCGVMGSKLKELALGALFHDLGLTQVPPHMYFSGYDDGADGSETAEMAKKRESHTVIGWKLIKDNLKLKNLIPYIALRHHELLDYSGYPGGEDLGSEIHPLARIVGIVDAYDMATSRKNGKEPQQSPTDFIEEILMNEKKYDKAIVDRFCRTVMFYPACSAVKLSNGMEGVVIRQNDNRLRPVVRVKGAIPEIDLSKPECRGLKVTYCNY